MNNTFINFSKGSEMGLYAGDTVLAGEDNSPHVVSYDEMSGTWFLVNMLNGMAKARSVTGQLPYNQLVGTVLIKCGGVELLEERE